jgi:hypothetical protein
VSWFVFEQVQLGVVADSFDGAASVHVLIEWYTMFVFVFIRYYNGYNTVSLLPFLPSVFFAFLMSFCFGFYLPCLALLCLV